MSAAFLKETGSSFQILDSAMENALSRSVTVQDLGRVKSFRVQDLSEHLLRRGAKWSDR